ncbi:Hypothetical predicted protein [Scomber scombrus]|uniref:Uncharacterized protein n=1 Tax=Scomber scombrus TaxID=13677 RepID=A0AAV1NML8_SCOSC
MRGSAFVFQVLTLRRHLALTPEQVLTGDERKRYLDNLFDHAAARCGGETDHTHTNQVTVCLTALRLLCLSVLLLWVCCFHSERKESQAGDCNSTLSTNHGQPTYTVGPRFVKPFRSGLDVCDIKRESPAETFFNITRRSILYYPIDSGRRMKRAQDIIWNKLLI